MALDVLFNVHIVIVKQLFPTIPNEKSAAEWMTNLGVNTDLGRVACITLATVEAQLSVWYSAVRYGVTIMLGIGFTVVLFVLCAVVGNLFCEFCLEPIFYWTVGCDNNYLLFSTLSIMFFKPMLYI